MTFKLFDVNNDGGISVTEIERTFKALGLPLSKAEAQYIIDRFDTDGNGEIGYEEFLVFLREYAMTSRKKSSGLFGFFDKNDDGFINVQEFIDAMALLGTNFSEEEAKELLRPYWTEIPVSGRKVSIWSIAKKSSIEMGIDSKAFIKIMTKLWLDKNTSVSSKHSRKMTEDISSDTLIQYNQNCRK